MTEYLTSRKEVPFSISICEFLEDRYQRTITPSQVQAVRVAAPDDETADATSKFIVPGPNGDEAFLIISGHSNAELVARAVKGIRTARTILSNPAREVVLLPLLEGRIAGLSCAAWPRHRPFFTEQRVQWYFRRWHYAPTLLDWTYKLCAETLSPVGSLAGDTLFFKKALSNVASDPKFPDLLRSDADIAIARLESERWQPRHCLQHGDLWAGNFLLPKHSGGPVDFFVVDWAGMKFNGFPVFDLVRLSESLRCTRRLRDKTFQRFAALLDCEMIDLRGYLLAALGSLGEDLEFFSQDAYYGMSIRSHTYLKFVDNDHD